VRRYGFGFSKLIVAGASRLPQIRIDQERSERGARHEQDRPRRHPDLHAGEGFIEPRG
jgi:hypothetical protein